MTRDELIALAEKHGGINPDYEFNTKTDIISFSFRQFEAFAATLSSATQAGGGLTFPQKEFDALLDHIYEHGTTAEGVKRRAEKMIKAALAASPVPLSDTGAQEVSKAVQHVLAERQRQIGMGWTPEHDDHHAGGDIARAAAAYCLLDEWTPNQGVPHPMHQARWFNFNILRAIWPSNWTLPTPKDKRTNLVRAGALILAELERIDRKTAK